MKTPSTAPSDPGAPIDRLEQPVSLGLVAAR